MRLNGWQRLWVLASLLWGLFLIAMVVTNWRTQDSTWGGVTYRASDANQSNIIEAMVFWLGASAAAYALGWMIAWVIRGFRGHRN